MDRNRSLRARLDDTGAHSAIVDLLADTDRLAVVLAADARDAGTHQPGRDYQAEADQLAPVIALAMQQVTEPELVRAAEIAALHDLHAA